VSDLVAMDRALLGWVLMHPERMPDIGALEPTDLHLPVEHGLILGACRRLWDRGAPIDYRTVVDELARDGHLERVGGAEYICDLDRGVPAGLDVAGYVREIKLAAANRRLLAELELTKQRILKDPHALTNGLRTRHVQAVSEIADSVALQRSDVFLDVDGQLARHSEYLNHEGEQTVQSGFSGLDELTGGIRAGEVFGVMARPGTGKTLWLANVADFVLHTNESIWVLFVSLEMPAAQIVERLMRIVLNVSSYKLREDRTSGALALDEYRRRFARLLLVDRPGLSLPQIGDLVRQAQTRPAKASTLVLMIDHFGLLGGDRGTTVYERVSTQARELKELAKRYDIPVVVAIQVSREAGGDGSKELGLGAARDSGVIEEAMDYLVALRQPGRQVGLSPQEMERYRDRVMLRLVKNRHGALGQELPLKLDPVSLRMWETVG
jgi:replicative DNA helicase